MSTPSTPTRATPRATCELAALLLLAACALVPYAHTFHYGFINLDDGFTIVNMPLIRELSWAALPKFFAPDRYALLPEYMPLKNLSYAIDYALFGLSAPGFRAQQYVWYVASVWMVWLWLRGLLARLAELERLGIPSQHAATLALAATALFALHPAHVESVVWLSSRKDLLCAAFMAAALAAALRASIEKTRTPGAQLAWGGTALLCTWLALLSKPTAFVLLPLFLLQEYWIVPPGSTLWQHARPRVLGFVLVAASMSAFLVIYTRVVGGLSSDELTAMKFHGSPLLRVGQQLWAYLAIGFGPVELLPIYPPALLDERALSLGAVRGVVTVLMSAAAFAWGVRRRHVLGFALGLFVLALAPSLLRPVWGQYVAARYAFLSVLGVSLAVCWLFLRLGVLQRMRIAAFGICSIALLWGVLGITYSAVWRDSASLWGYAADVYPRFARFYDLGARGSMETGDVDAALRTLTRCVQYNPEASECLAPLGGLLLLRDPARGEALLKRALPGDGTGMAHQRLAQYWASQGRAKDALRVYAAWLQHRQAGSDAIEVLIDLALRAGDVHAAVDALPRLVHAAAVGQPASPPPAASVLRVLERSGPPDTLARAREAARSCTRSDAFAAAMRW